MKPEKKIEIEYFYQFKIFMRENVIIRIKQSCLQK